MVSEDDPLLHILRILRSESYRFVAVTPETHARVLARPSVGRPTLRDVFGWSKPFVEADISPELLACLKAANALQVGQDGLASRIRVASLGANLFVHSAYPTTAMDAVFFGPDTYRFTRWIGTQLEETGKVGWLLDMGAGTGAGAIVAASCCAVRKTTLVDINEIALRYAAINAHAAGVAVETLHSNQVSAGPDLMIANPPYLMDPGGRAYRDGGASLGGELALDWCKQALARLAPGGQLLLYTGAAIRDGESPLLNELQRVCDGADASIAIEDIDVDVFGEELSTAVYDKVDRIGVFGISVRTASTN